MVDGLKEPRAVLKIEKFKGTAMVVPGVVVRLLLRSLKIWVEVESRLHC